MFGELNEKWAFKLQHTKLSKTSGTKYRMICSMVYTKILSSAAKLITYEPGYSISRQLAWAPSGHRSACASAQDNRRLHFPPDALDPWLPIECAAKTVIRLQGDLNLRRVHMLSWRKCCASDCIHCNMTITFGLIERWKFWTNYLLTKLCRLQRVAHK